MPPKKAGKKSGKKKGKKSAVKQALELPSKIPLNGTVKEVYYAQLKDLEDRLGRYETRTGVLTEQNDSNQQKLSQLTSDKKDMVAFLKKNLEQRDDELSDMNDILVGLQQAKDTEKEQYESELQQLRTEYQETKDTLTTDNMLLNGKLASLEEFKNQREELMRRYESLEADLGRQEQEQKRRIADIEAKAVKDKDRLKKDMVMKVNQVAAEFRKVSNKQMAETTKRTIRENVSINAQIAKMTDKTQELEQENDELRTKEKEQRKRIRELEENEKEVAKKNHSNQKIIQLLTEKCSEMEAGISEFEERSEDYRSRENENMMLNAQVQETRERLQQMDEQRETLHEQREERAEQIEQMTRERDALVSVLANAAQLLQRGLTSSSPEDEEESEEDEDAIWKELLDLLSSSGLETGMSPSDVQGLRPKSSEIPGTRRGIQRGEMPPVAPPGSRPHYTLGDLGFVPKPHVNLGSFQEKTREIASAAKRSQMRRALSKTVSTQTASGPKAMFLADEMLSKMPKEQRASLLHADMR